MGELVLRPVHVVIIDTDHKVSTNRGGIQCMPTGHSQSNGIVRMHGQYLLLATLHIGYHFIEFVELHFDTTQ